MNSRDKDRVTTSNQEQVTIKPSSCMDFPHTHQGHISKDVPIL